jgi:hypothetical protein
VIGISTPTLDIDGDIVIDEHSDTDISRYSRRVNGIATLDGGVEITDNGYADVDRTISIVVESSVSIMQQLKYLIENYSIINLATRNGFNTAAISKLEDRGGLIKMECVLAT